MQLNVSSKFCQPIRKLKPKYTEDENQVTSHPQSLKLQINVVARPDRGCSFCAVLLEGSKRTATSQSALSLEVRYMIIDEAGWYNIIEGGKKQHDE
jgi:hypothetical protein